MADTYYWLNYEFLVAEPYLTSCFKRSGGVYIFAKPAPQDRWLHLRTGPNKYLAGRLRQEAWVPLYIGMATNLAQRLNLDHRAHWAAAQRLGATHVHVRFERFHVNRMLMERQLIEEFDPPVNRRLRKKRWIRSEDL
jgi:hypothetical protein